MAGACFRCMLERPQHLNGLRGYFAAPAFFANLLAHSGIGSA